MIIRAHCFAEKVKIDKLPITFKYGEYDVQISLNKSEENEGLTLEISKKIEPSDVDFHNEVKDEKGGFIEKRLRPYKETLTEVAHLVEGYLSIMYNAEPPRFNPEKTFVNVQAETPEEQEMITKGEVSGGFGDILHPPKYPLYNWSEKIIPSLSKGEEHIASFSFLAQALRSQQRNDQEVAFFLYFRIIEGYFSDGTKDIEKALLNKKDELAKYILYTDEVKQIVKAVLDQLQLPSKASKDFEGLISDLVLIRHKLTHFSKTNSNRHHTTSVNFELNPLNNLMRRACILFLRDTIGI
jgi:hypothetical protein